MHTLHWFVGGFKVFLSRSWPCVFGGLPKRRPRLTNKTGALDDPWGHRNLWWSYLGLYSLTTDRLIAKPRGLSKDLKAFDDHRVIYDFKGIESTEDFSQWIWCEISPISIHVGVILLAKWYVVGCWWILCLATFASTVTSTKTLLLDALVRWCASVGKELKSSLTCQMNI